MPSKERHLARAEEIATAWEEHHMKAANIVDDVSKREWSRGFVCAVALILETHADEVVAADVLRANRSAVAHADPEDIETLKRYGLIP